MERLLCVKIASRGDLILAAPAFRELRRHRPGVLMELLVGQSCLDVAHHIPFFDAIHPIDDRRLLAGNLMEKWDASRQLIRQIQNDKDPVAFTEVILFHRDWRYGALFKMAGIPIRRGFRSHRGGWLLTHPYRAVDHEHHIDQYIGVADVRKWKRVDRSLSGIWSFLEGEKEGAIHKAIGLGIDLDRKGSVAFGFGGGRNVKTVTSLKSWPMDSYRKLAAELHAAGRQVIWLGDVHDAKEMRGDEPGLSLAGKLTIDETAVVVSLCSQVVSNDTFILHLAGAVGVPVYGLFGPTDPAHYRPIDEGSDYGWIGKALPCCPCHRDGWFPRCRFDHACMKQLSLDGVRQWLRGTL